MAVMAMRCPFMALLSGELWKGYWGTLGFCSFLQVCGGQVAAWMGLDAQHCVHCAWLQGDLSFQLKPTQITSSTGPTTSLLQAVRAQ